MSDLWVKAGQTLLIVAGVGIGILRGRGSFPVAAGAGQAQLAELEGNYRALAESVRSLEDRTTLLESVQGDVVTHSQLDSAIELAFAPLCRDLDRRFQQQAESVEALRAMVSRTDELLDRVLENLESMEHQAAA